MEKLQLFLAFAFFLCVDSQVWNKVWTVSEEAEITFTCTVSFRSRHEKDKHFDWGLVKNGVMTPVADCSLTKCHPYYGVPHTFTLTKHNDSAATSTMTIHRVTKYHEGYWICTAFYLTENVLAAKLIVLEKDAQVCYVFEGQKLTVTCKISINETRFMGKQLFWSKIVPYYRDYLLVGFCDDDGVTCQEQFKHLPGIFSATKPNAGTAILKMTLPSIQKADEGRWYCHGAAMIHDYPIYMCELKVVDAKVCPVFLKQELTLTCTLTLDHNISQNRTLFWLNKVSETYETVAICEEKARCRVVSPTYKATAVFTMKRPNETSAILKMIIPTVRQRDEGFWFCYGPSVVQQDLIPVCILEVIVPADD